MGAKDESSTRGLKSIFPFDRIIFQFSLTKAPQQKSTELLPSSFDAILYPKQ
jgi:hypothetical protein